MLSGGVIRFVADPNQDNGAIGANLGVPKAKLTPDGNVLVFKSSKPLTSDAVASSCAAGDNNLIPHPCVELYRYDDRDGSLECLSCLHGGTTTGELGNGYVSTNNIGFDLSVDGDTAVFTTTQALLPARQRHRRHLRVARRRRAPDHRRRHQVPRPVTPCTP